jgi:hypothetical protein
MKKRGMKPGTKRITRSGTHYLTIADLGKRWGLSRATINRMLYGYKKRNGEYVPATLTADKVGYFTRVPIAEVERYEAERPPVQW